MTSIVFHRWFGVDNSMFFQSVSAAKYATQQEDGTDLEQTLKIGWISEALENKWNWRTILDDSDMARGHTIRYSLFWFMNGGSSTINKHRIVYVYRRPLCKRWIYLEIAPGIDIVGPDSPDRRPDSSDLTAQAVTGWEIIPIVRVGVDMLFWGTYER